MKKKSTLLVGISLAFVLLLAACSGPTASPTTLQPAITVSPNFQSRLSPIPTVPTYRCGAWSSNNAPGPNETITIFARLTKDIAAVSGAMATAVVHFQGGDQTLNQHPVSDSGGYVSFTLALQGQQPLNIPATVDVIFTNFPGGTLHCSQAFFTPQ
ncbi:MAG TPA: hypothetical protein VKR83_05170 [Ktedonobacteraceae bacterium]|nr:hypothetical protein [Ktedonobacteraceae bacterium]